MRYLTAAEIVVLYRVPVGTVYWLAHRDRWRRIPGRPVLYDAGDVDDTMHTERPAA